MSQRCVSVEEIRSGIETLSTNGAHLMRLIDEGEIGLEDGRRRGSGWADLVVEHLSVWFDSSDEAARFKSTGVRIVSGSDQRQRSVLVLGLGDRLAWLETLSARAAIMRELDASASHERTVQFLTVPEQQRLERFLSDLEAALERGEQPADPEDQAVLDAERQTLDVQLRSPKPNRGVVRSALRSIGRVFEGGAANVAG